MLVPQSGTNYRASRDSSIMISAITKRADAGWPDMLSVHFCITFGWKYIVKSGSLIEKSLRARYMIMSYLWVMILQN